MPVVSVLSLIAPIFPGRDLDASEVSEDPIASVHGQAELMAER